MRTLHLTLKKKWFDMIASGEKKEEYREIKPYWATRFSNLPYDWCTDIDLFKNQFVRHCTGFEQNFRYFDQITFRNGYQKNAPTITVQCLGIDIGEAKPEWSDNWQGDVFRIKLGEIINNQ